MTETGERNVDFIFYVVLKLKTAYLAPFCWGDDTFSSFTDLDREAISKDAHFVSIFLHSHPCFFFLSFFVPGRFSKGCLTPAPRQKLEAYTAKKVSRESCHVP